MKKIIIPAIIAKDQKELVKRINKVKKYSKIIQIDIMGEGFVKNNSFDFDYNNMTNTNWEKLD